MNVCCSVHSPMMRHLLAVFMCLGVMCALATSSSSPPPCASGDWWCYLQEFGRIVAETSSPLPYFSTARAPAPTPPSQTTASTTPVSTSTPPSHDEMKRR